MKGIRSTRRRLHGDDAFTLVETVLAMVVTLIVLSALLLAYVQALGTVTLGKQRQAATGLATKVLEQLRALPYADLEAGLNSADSTLTGDPNVSGGNFVPVIGGINEPMVFSTSQSKAPLNPHRSTTTIDGVQYTVGTYVTKPAGAKAFNLSVLVTWSSSVSNGSKTVIQRSTAFSPTRCLNPATHPYSGPCQAFYSGQAGLTAGSISVTNNTDSSLPISGFTGEKIEFGLPGLSSSLSVEQITKMASIAQTSSAKVTDSGTATGTGGVSVSAPADSDPSSVSQTTSTGSAAQSGGAVQLSGTAGKLTAQPGGSDSGNVTSNVAASSSSCYDHTGVAINTTQPCSMGSVTPSGAGGSIELDLSGAAAIRSLPAFPLASVAAASTPSRAVAARVINPGGTACPTAATGGCVVAAASRHLGTTTVGTIPAPSSGDSVPSGFTYAFRVSGLSESAYSESGIGTRSTPSSYSRSGGTLSFWNGSSYSSVNLTTLTADTTYTVPTVIAVYPSGPNNITISLSSSIRAAKAVSPTITGTAPCKTSPCTGSATGASVLRATTDYVVTVNGTVLAEFVVVTDLGSITAQSSYLAAPDA